MTPIKLLLCSLAVLPFAWYAGRQVPVSLLGFVVALLQIASFICIPVSLVWLILTWEPKP